MSMHRPRRRAFARLATLGLLPALAPFARAQTPGQAAAPATASAGAWPKGLPIKLIVPFTAGSATDVIARVLAEKLGPALATQVIVDNRPGAGGTLGAALVAKSPPDGATLLIHSSGHLVNPSIYPRLSYDTLKDFEGITTLANLPNVLVVAPAKGYKDVQDLITKAKASPDALNYASAGNGSATHMSAEKFRVASGLKAQHVPFRGTPEALTETIAGRIDWFFAPLVSALPLIKDGKLKALAVGTAQRSPVLPEVPTLAESGLPEATYTFWIGLFAPAHASREIVARLHDESVKILALPEVKERLEKLGATPMPMSLAGFDRYLNDETAAATQLVKAANIRIE